MTDSLDPFLTPPEIAKLLRVSSEKVLGWIRKAELKAVNASEGFLPRYRIRREDLDYSSRVERYNHLHHELHEYVENP